MSSISEKIDKTHKVILQAWDEFKEKLKNRLRRWGDWNYDVFKEDTEDELLLKIVVKKRLENYCQKCDNAWVEGFNYCPICGTKLTQEPLLGNKCDHGSQEL